MCNEKTDPLRSAERRAQDALVRRIIARRSSGVPSLGQGKFSTQQDVDAKRAKILAYDFTPPRK